MGLNSRCTWAQYLQPKGPRVCKFQQLWSMGINIAESAISVILTYLLVPRLAVTGFILVVYFNEIFNFAMSFGKLRSIIADCKSSETAV